MFHHCIVFVLFIASCYLVNATFSIKGLDRKTQARVQAILLGNPRFEVYGGFANKVYFYSSDKFTNEQAAAYCRNNSMELELIRDADELTYLLGQNSPPRYMWTSASAINSFRWANGTGEVVDIPYRIGAEVCLDFAQGQGLYQHKCSDTEQPLCELAS